MQSQAMRRTAIGAVTLAATYSVLGIETAQARDGMTVETVPTAKPVAQPDTPYITLVRPITAPPEASRQPVFTQSAASTHRRSAPAPLHRLQETRLNTVSINRDAIFKSASEHVDTAEGIVPASSQLENIVGPESPSQTAVGEALQEKPKETDVLPTTTADTLDTPANPSTTQRFSDPASPSTQILASDQISATEPISEVEIPTQYQVQKGDTLHKIANSLGVSLEDLVEANNIDDPDVIIAGAALVLPTAEAAESTAKIQQPAPETPAPETPAETETADTPPQIAIANPPAQDRLTRLQATVSRPVESVTLLSQLQGNDSEPLPLKDTAVSVLETNPDENATHDVSAAIDSALATDSLATDSTTAEAQSVESDPASSTEQPDVYLASLLDSVAAANTDTEATEAIEPAASPLVSRSSETLLATAPLDNAEWIRQQAPRAGDSVEATTPLLPSADEFLPQASDAFTGYVWPTHGTMTSGYGWRWGRMHRGVDIAAPVGTPVMAAAPGVVEYAQWNNGGYGNLVDIRHADGSMTRYAHNNRLVVRPGQRVQQGQLIAEMGSTGYSTGPHLHFEIHPPNSGATNPLALLPNRR